MIIPTEHHNIKVEPAREVSSVSTTSPKMNSQETQTGMSSQAQTPNTSWFWKLTDMFRVGLSCQVNSVDSSGPFL